MTAFCLENQVTIDFKKFLHVFIIASTGKVFQKAKSGEKRNFLKKPTGKVLFLIIFCVDDIYSGQNLNPQSGNPAKI